MSDRIHFQGKPHVTQEELERAMGPMACGPAGSAPHSRLSRRKDPETSHEAAARVEPELGKSQAWLLKELRWSAGHSKVFCDWSKGFTDKNLHDLLRNRGHTIPRGLRTGSGIRTRRLELARAGKLELVAADGSGVPYREDGQYAVELMKRQRSMVWRLTGEELA